MDILLKFLPKVDIQIQSIYTGPFLQENCPAIAEETRTSFSNLNGFLGPFNPFDDNNWMTYVKPGEECQIIYYLGRLRININRPELQPIDKIIGLQNFYNDYKNILTLDMKNKINFAIKSEIEEMEKFSLDHKKEQMINEFQSLKMINKGTVKGGIPDINNLTLAFGTKNFSRTKLIQKNRSKKFLQY